MILRQESAQDWLTRTENEATQHLLEAERHWIAFCQKALAIKDSGLYKQKAKTWHEYVRVTWDRDSSRIRQFKSALPYAEKLQQAYEDLATPESNIRKMKQAGIDPDDPDMPKIYKTVINYAQDNEISVQASHFKHAKSVYEEAEITGGYVDIGEDEIVPIDWEGSTKLAMARSIEEANMRYKQRLRDKRKAVTVSARRISDNQFLITSDEPLPDSFEFKIWKDLQ